MIYIEIIQGFAHIQDLGRYGYRHLGVSHGGAMDSLALQAGNLLLKNANNAPAIELTLGVIATRHFASPVHWWRRSWTARRFFPITATLPTPVKR
ncbi:hypothetical protein GKDKLJBG_02045 [Mannheimia haemolytica]